MIKYEECELCDSIATYHCSNCGYDLCDFDMQNNDICPGCEMDMTDDFYGWVEKD